MKKFNKESMQNFMLLHAEKLILGACIAATGLFIWMSMGGEDGLAAKTPSDLSKEVDSSQTFIDADKWDVLKPLREGEKQARQKIEGAKRVEPDKYSRPFIGTPVPASAPRLDPDIVAPEQLIANYFPAGVLMDLPEFESPLVEFFKAPERLGDGTGGGLARRGGGGGGAPGDFNSGGRGGFGGGAPGEGGGGGGFNGGLEGLPEAYPPLDLSGGINEVNRQTMPGLRPLGFNISADRITTNVLDVVSVRAVVDFQKQDAAFEKAFAQSIAYNAKRDRPVYQFVDVERREVSDKETEWQNISEKVAYSYPSQYPQSMTKMPFQLSSSAPEVIAPENYDPILSGVIPGFVMLDYEELASHPALKQRREFPEWKASKKKRENGRWWSHSRRLFWA